MPTIELSADFYGGSGTSAQYRVIYPTGGDGTAPAAAHISTLLNGALTTNYPMTTLSLMKGSIPTDFSNTVVSARSADILVTWKNVYAGGGGAGHQMVPTGYNPTIINSVYVAATASGLATWFWWLSRPGSASDTPGNNITHQIYGTVGTSGSGADLELPDTNIVSGQSYRFLNLRVAVAGPTYTY